MTSKGNKNIVSVFGSISFHKTNKYPKAFVFHLILLFRETPPNHYLTKTPIVLLVVTCWGSPILAGLIRTQLSRAESCSARVLSEDKYGRGCPSWVNAWCLIIQWGTMMFDNWPLGMYILHCTYTSRPFIQN